jgi:stage III sporulation protein AH
MISIAKSTEIETKIEGLIKAKGFSDCMVYISDESVNVVVASKGLSQEQAAQINEIVIAETKRDASAIKIVEIKTA